jgi:serine/threonine protein phosphatase Stp1
VSVCVQSPPRSRRGAHLGGYKFLAVGRTHVGRVRTLNEDAYLNRPDIGLWAVADGMGGHARGEVASAAVIEALEGVTGFSSAYAFRDGVTRALCGVNDTLVSQTDDAGMGSTVVTLLAHNGHFACLWAGDSRAYLYRNNALRRLTRDHSLVQEMVEAGALSAEEARSHPRANIITRAVGVRAALCLDDVCGVIEPGDRFLLCSDGLTGAVSDRVIAETMRRAPLEWAAQSLIELALAGGGSDNVTAVLIGVEAS